jgi:hypothetical protein
MFTQTKKKKIKIVIPIGTFNPFGLLIASRNTLEFEDDPSHPTSTYINLISLVHTPKTFVARPPFLVRYLGLSDALGVTAI